MQRRLTYLLTGILLYLFLASVPFLKRLPLSRKYTENFSLGRFYANDGSVNYATLIANNDRARIERLRAIEHAKEKIKVACYRLKADASGKLFTASLVNAAKRGVKIDIILDVLSLKLNAGKNKYYKALNSFENVNIVVHNPLRFLKPWTLFGRMHEKYMIVEDKLAFVGGRNIEDRFLVHDADAAYDWEVLVYSEKRAPDDVVAQLDDYFDEMKKRVSTSLDRACLFATDRENARILEELDGLYREVKVESPANYDVVDYRETDAGGECGAD